MNVRTAVAPRGAVFRHSARDASLVVVALVNAVVLAVATTARTTPSFVASALFEACAIWWSSNTVSHNHLHNPIFVARRANLALRVGQRAALQTTRP